MHTCFAFKFTCFECWFIYITNFVVFYEKDSPKPLNVTPINTPPVLYDDDTANMPMILAQIFLNAPSITITALSSMLNISTLMAKNSNNDARKVSVQL